MAHKAPQQNTESAPKKKPSFLVRLALTLAALVMVLVTVALVAFRNTLNLDSIKRFFTYRALVLSDSGQAEAFHYDGQISDCFEVLDGDLLVCSQNTLSLYSGSGTRYVNESVSLEHPVVDAAGELAVVYDAGGSSLYVLGQRELIWSSQDMESILAAHINRQGQLTVVTQHSGYRGAVTVYNSVYEPIMSVRIHSAFVMDAALSDDGRTLAILTIGQQEGDFASQLSYYTMNSASAPAGKPSDYTPEHTVDLGGLVELAMRHTESQTWVLGDRGLAVAGHSGEAAFCDWSGRYLKLFDLGGDGFSVALLGKYRAGSQAVLQVMDKTAQVTASLDLNEQVLSLSAAGRYLAVLTGDRLDIYTADLTLYASLEGTQGTRKVLLMEDGSAILISAESASFFIPN